MSATSGADIPVVDPPWARWLGAVTSWMAALAIFWVFVGWAGVLLVFGSAVIPMWVAGLVFLFAGTVTGVSLEFSDVLHPDLLGWRRARRTVTAAAWVLIPLATVLGVIGGASYVVAEPPGCRAVVSETAFRFAGSGSVHVAGGWGPFAPQVGSYSTDDGLKPVSTRDYIVRWDNRFGGGGVLNVDNVMPHDGAFNGGNGIYGFDC